ncbi:GNAT family N-acetyltransferase [Ornithinibacillus sp. BX22]|uniref:GNAT family N-acetyltransferase n=1 Tax=Ornithinibacillus hominis TaxID=2763055 RepID=A0A923L979_9BACI|nr:GNAT family N-acetyltransferase [Ornithinibacillus hominis]
MVERYIKGSILSNTIHNPSAVLMETDSGTYCLAGEPSNSFIDTFRAYYDENKGKRFTIFSPNKCCDDVIESIVTPDTKKMERKILKLNTKSFAEKVNTIKKPGDFKFHPISRDAITISNNFNEAYYHAHWVSIEQYLTNGICYYATNSAWKRELFLYGIVTH